MAERSSLTPRQLEAVRTVDRSLLVSAAAGSGKTTVLAERCAYLVCDLPPGQRCDVDELLVVTFTEAAAGEMRSRISSTIRKRLEGMKAARASVRELDRLRLQIHLLDSADISTIHSFCKSLITRWFPQAGVDPQASVLSEEEAGLLRRETLDAIFAELYLSEGPPGEGFRALVDDYAGGKDATIADTILRAHAFVCSLPDPAGWIEACASEPARLAERIDAVQRERIRGELRLQIDSAEAAAETIRRCWPVAQSRLESVNCIIATLRGWLERIEAAGSSWEALAQEICGHEFESCARKPKGVSPADGSAYDQALARLNDLKKTCLKRLTDAMCRFTAAEYHEGLERIASYTQTIAQIVAEFDRRYSEVKRQQAVLDFNDLQRFALRVLCEDGDPDGPSEVARELQRHYRYVLVDEFQDVDPLQASILRLVSGEAADPPHGNLFVVGDIKQSIYRFRLAEPQLFIDRTELFDRLSAGEAVTGGSSLGRLIRLQENFRSRGDVVDAINCVFRPLMTREFGGSDYDKDAELNAKAVFPPAGTARTFGRPAIELHLLEPVTQATRVDKEAGQESGGVDPESANGEEGSPDTGDELEGIEREAWLIGTRIQDWMNGASGRVQVGEKGGTALRPIAYRDIVILLRSTMHKADPIADVLRRMGIPVRVDRGDDSLDSTEFRDVHSLLQVLDNGRQDIPLTAVMRSPLAGPPFSASDLLRIRLSGGRLPFHLAVERYAHKGEDTDLKERVATMLARLKRWRERVSRTPVADVLWEIYGDTEYLAYVSGLPDGARRREHLVRLHELARQFGQFARQGLRRFLRFLDEIVASEQRGGPAAPGADDDVVRIMTIHASKGLEFPVVILADMHKPFNLSDCNAPVLLDRAYKIAMCAADPERRIKYPTLIQQCAQEHARRESLSEELRVLYVALTRAREHLMLVGRVSPSKVEVYRSLAGESGGGARIPRLELLTASHALCWVLPALAAAPPGMVDWCGGDSALVTVSVYDRAATDQWQIPAAQEEARREALALLADLRSLPPSEPIAPEESVRKVFEPLCPTYAGLELTTMPARVAVTDLKRRWDPLQDPDERKSSRGAAVRKKAKDRRPPPVAQPVFYSKRALIDPVHRGTATHRFLQLIDLARPCDAAGLAEQRDEMVASGRLAPPDANVVMLEAAAWFLGTELGRRLRVGAPHVIREMPFVSRVPPEAYDPLVRARDTSDLLLIRGMVDAMLSGPDGLELIDYKTDAIRPAEVADRAEFYRRQVDSYATAMQGIYQRPVVKRWLVFLHVRCVVDLSPTDPEGGSAPGGLASPADGGLART